MIRRRSGAKPAVLHVVALLMPDSYSSLPAIADREGWVVFLPASCKKDVHSPKLQQKAVPQLSPMTIDRSLVNDALKVRQKLMMRPVQLHCGQHTTRTQSFEELPLYY